MLEEVTFHHVPLSYFLPSTHHTLNFLVFSPLVIAFLSLSMKRQQQEAKDFVCLIYHCIPDSVRHRAGAK